MAKIGNTTDLGGSAALVGNSLQIWASLGTSGPGPQIESALALRVYTTLHEWEQRNNETPGPTIERQAPVRSSGTAEVQIVRP